MVFDNNSSVSMWGRQLGAITPSDADDITDPGINGSDGNPKVVASRGLRVTGAGTLKVKGINDISNNPADYPSLTVSVGDFVGIHVVRVFNTGTTATVQGGY